MILKVVIYQVSYQIVSTWLDSNKGLSQNGCFRQSLFTMEHAVATIYFLPKEMCRCLCSCCLAAIWKKKTFIHSFLIFLLIQKNTIEFQCLWLSFFQLIFMINIQAHAVANGAPAADCNLFQYRVSLAVHIARWATVSSFDRVSVSFNSHSESINCCKKNTATLYI